MLSQVYIKNFKAFEKETINISKHNMIIGENDAGKTTILSALDIFFNTDENYKIDKSVIRNLKEDVEIGVWINDEFYKKFIRQVHLNYRQLKVMLAVCLILNLYIFL